MGIKISIKGTEPAIERLFVLFQKLCLLFQKLCLLFPFIGLIYFTFPLVFFEMAFYCIKKAFGGLSSIITAKENFSSKTIKMVVENWKTDQDRK